MFKLIPLVFTSVFLAGILKEIYDRGDFKFLNKTNKNLEDEEHCGKLKAKIYSLLEKFKS